MDPISPGSVQYERWNENNINMDIEAPQSTAMRIYNRVCSGSSGEAVKAAGVVAALVSLYILGYLTGYYIHKCL